MSANAVLLVVEGGEVTQKTVEEAIASKMPVVVRRVLV